MATERPQAGGYTRIELCVRRGAEPIEGTCQGGSGRAAPFWGWLELISALETARATDPPPARPEGASSEGGVEAARGAEGERGECPTSPKDGRQAR
jgi:hypothetical protein